MMDLSLISYVGVMSVTPGPNNLLLATSGVHFGLRRTVPQVLGISSGHFLQVFVVAVAFSTIIGWLEGLRFWLALAGCGYLLVLSWQILRAGSPGEKAGHRPLRYYEALLFQGVNPKAWVMVVNVAILFAPRGPSLVEGSLVLAAVCALINLPCVGLWAVTGDRLRKFLAQGHAALVFNAVMAALMAGTTIWLFVEELGRVSMRL